MINLIQVKLKRSFVIIILLQFR